MNHIESLVHGYHPSLEEFTCIHPKENPVRWKPTLLQHITDRMPTSFFGFTFRLDTNHFLRLGVRIVGECIAMVTVLFFAALMTLLWGL